nr:reverse transcriptase domain-containing protein [Tanacetum cinerariifolium]
RDQEGKGKNLRRPTRREERKKHYSTEAPILMINQEEACRRNNISKIPTFEGSEIAFPSPPPPVTKGSNSSAPIVIKDRIFERKVGEGVKKIKETSPTNIEGVLSCTDVEEKIVVNSKCPEQTVTVEKQLPGQFKERLRNLLRTNTYFFAWTHADMTGIPRTITVDGKPFNTKHKLNKGHKSRDNFSPYQGPNHEFLSTLSKSPREILATEKVARSFEQPPRMLGSSQQKRFTKTDLAVYSIKQREGESVRAFATRPSKAEAEEIERREMNLPTLLAAYLGRSKNGQPLRGSLLQPKDSLRFKTTGATYQRLVDKFFNEQTGRNLKAYVDDMVIKNTSEEDMLIDIYETFQRKEVGRKTDTKVEEMKPGCKWKLYTDGASSFDGSGIGLMLIDPEGKECTYALHFEFKTTNNKAKYEALLAGLRIAQEMEIVNLAIFVDSQLLVETKGEESWMTLIHEYLLSGLLPENSKESRKNRIKAPQYKLIIEIRAIASGNAWPFSHWGVSILRPLPTALEGLKFLAIAIKHSTKWIEAKPLTTKNARHIERFVWEYVRIKNHTIFLHHHRTHRDNKENRQATNSKPTRMGGRFNSGIVDTLKTSKKQPEGDTV